MTILPSDWEGTVPACGHMGVPVSSLVRAWRWLATQNALLGWSTRPLKPESVRRSGGSLVISGLTWPCRLCCQLLDELQNNNKNG